MTFIDAKNNSNQIHVKLFLVKTSQSSRFENYLHNKTTVIIIIPL